MNKEATRALFPNGFLPPGDTLVGTKTTKETLVNANNPGNVDPASQAYPAPPTRPAPPSPRRLATTSDGEIQPKCSPDVLSTPSSAGGSGAVTQSSGERQYRDLRPADPAAPTSVGLPANVAAGTARPGGLPVEIMIK